MRTTGCSEVPLRLMTQLGELAQLAAHRWMERGGPRPRRLTRPADTYRKTLVDLEPELLDPP
jgi:hypothetical protein